MRQEDGIESRGSLPVGVANDKLVHCTNKPNQRSQSQYLLESKRESNGGTKLSFPCRGGNLNWEK